MEFPEMREIIGKKQIRTVFILILLICSFNTYGQNHLIFMGHPIVGDMKEYVKALEKDGFKTLLNKGWFPKMKTKYLRGKYWKLNNCDIVVRRHKASKGVTSVYIHPKNNFLLLNELISILDYKYGRHSEDYSIYDSNSIIYSWIMPEGSIRIFGSTVYGQSFNILYQDFAEVQAKK